MSIDDELLALVVAGKGREFAEVTRDRHGAGSDGTCRLLWCDQIFPCRSHKHATRALEVLDEAERRTAMRQCRVTVKTEPVQFLVSAGHDFAMEITRIHRDGNNGLCTRPSCLDPWPCFDRRCADKALKILRDAERRNMATALDARPSR